MAFEMKNMAYWKAKNNISPAPGKFMGAIAKVAKKIASRIRNVELKKTN